MADRIHRLKIWPSRFAAVKDGRKPFEIRYAGDRDFAVGDYLVLDWWDPALPKGSEHCGDEEPLIRKVTYLSRRGLTDDYICMGIAPIDDDTFCRVLDGAPPLASNEQEKSDG